MTGPWMALLAIAGSAVLYVLLPIVAHAFGRYRKPRVVRCPDTGTAAEIRIDARHAALTAVPGPPEARVAECSRWPEHASCGQGCVVPGT